MLYLLEPNGRMQWTDFPASTALAVADQQGVDLGDLEWRDDTSRLMSDDAIRLALRHGRTSKRGIVIEAIHLIDLDRAEELRRSYQNVVEAQAKLPQANEDFMEAVIPGWKADGERVDREIEASTRRSIEEAEANVEQLMSAEVQPGVLEAWRAAGGFVPQPA